MFKKDRVKTITITIEFQNAGLNICVIVHTGFGFTLRLISEPLLSAPIEIGPQSMIGHAETCKTNVMQAITYINVQYTPNMHQDVGLEDLEMQEKSGSPSIERARFELDSTECDLSSWISNP